MPVFKIHHITRYEYDRPVKESVNEIKIFPYQCVEQEVLMHEINITGNPSINIYNDYWGNKSGIFNLQQAHNVLSIESKLVLRTIGHLQLKQFNAGWQQLQQDVYQSMQLVELTMADAIESQEAITSIVQQIYQPWKSVAAVVQDCNQFIYQHFSYIKGITNIETTVDEILQHRSGVCQDFAHVMLQVLRTLKIPSRYVSGYICPNKNGMRGEGATHAWVEVWIPEHGWAGIDPTNNVWVTNTHVKLAVGRNFTDCTPVKGTFKGPAKQSLSVLVSLGYEDGHVFEELNKVIMPALEADAAIEMMPDDSQQQQQ